MTEIWVETGNTSRQNNTIVAISNKGRIRTKDGEIRVSKRVEKVTQDGERTLIHRLIAKHFIPKTEEDIRLNRNCIDHITHNPVGMNINDVRNLRWCTRKENNGFPEARENKRKAQLGKSGSRYHPRSDFSKKFYEHYGLHYSDDKKLYCKERQYYRRNKKCSWE